MRRTPPVVVHLQPQPAVQAAVALIAALAAGGLAAWAISHEPQAWSVLLAVPIAAFWAWREAAVLPRRLRWDGQAWWLAEPGDDDDTQVQLAVLIDFLNFMLSPPAQAMTYDDGYFYPGPAVKDVPLSMAPAASQKVIAEYGRPEYANEITSHPQELPLLPDQLVYAFSRWDEEIGSKKKK